jgi:hypothetical protein
MATASAYDRVSTVRRKPAGSDDDDDDGGGEVRESLIASNFIEGLRTGTMNRSFWILICCCFLVFWVGLAIAATALGLVIDLRNDVGDIEDNLEVHRYCVRLTGCKMQDQGAAQNPPECVGDPNGDANAMVTLHHHKACVEIYANDIQFPVRRLRVHGPLSQSETENGPLFFSFGESAAELPVTPPSPSGVLIEKCVDVDHDDVAAIEDQPYRFLLKAHNDEFPRGALRGELGDECRQRIDAFENAAAAAGTPGHCTAAAAALWFCLASMFLLY